MPATVVDEPLSVEFTFPNSDRTFTTTFADVPNPGLAADLTIGLAWYVHPHGGIGSRSSAQKFSNAVRKAIRDLDAAGFQGRARDLRRHDLIELWLADTRDQEHFLSKILTAYAEAAGDLAPEV